VRETELVSRWQTSNDARTNQHPKCVQQGGNMSTKIIASLYLAIYIPLLILSLVVTFSTSIGFWGLAGIALFGWLIWGQVNILLSSSAEG